MNQRIYLLKSGNHDFGTVIYGEDNIRDSSSCKILDLMDYDKKWDKVDTMELRIIGLLPN